MSGDLSDTAGSNHLFALSGAASTVEYDYTSLAVHGRGGRIPPLVNAAGVRVRYLDRKSSAAIGQT